MLKKENKKQKNKKPLNNNSYKVKIKKIEKKERKASRTVMDLENPLLYGKLSWVHSRDFIEEVNTV